MKKNIFSLLFIFIFANLALAQDLVIFNSTQQEITALYIQDSNIDASPTDLLQSKNLANNAGVKIALEGNISKMDLAIKKTDGQIQLWEQQDLSKANKITINPDMKLAIE